MNRIIYGPPILMMGLTTLPVLAATETNQVIMDELEIIAKPFEGISTETISIKQSDDLNGLFDDQANLTVGGGLGTAQKIYLRGFEDTLLNISIDGANQTGQLSQHQGRIAIDPDMLKQVEINAGVGSALNGFGTLGGAIKFVTKDAEDYLQEGQLLGGTLKGGFHSNNAGFRRNVTIYGHLGNQWSGLVSLGESDSSRIEDGNGNKIAFSETEQRLGLFKLSGQLAPDHNLKLSHDRQEDTGQRNMLAEFIHLPPWNSAGRQEATRVTTALDYRFEPESEWIDLSVTAYQTSREASLQDRASILAVKIDSQGLDFRNASFIGNHELVYGTEYRNDKTKNIRSYGVEKGDIYGVYIQDDYALNRALLLSMGARYDHYKLNDAHGQHFTSEGVSPNANLTYQINNAWTLQTGYGKALKGQISRQALSVGNDSNSANLKVEVAENTELSLQYRDRGLTAKASFFYSEIKDAVSLVGPPGPFAKQYKNVGTLRTKGFNIFVKQHWQRASLSASFSKTAPELNGQSLNDNNYGLGKSSGDTLILNARYDFPNQNIDVDWTSKFVQSVSGKNSLDPGKPKYDSHNVYLRWAALPKEKLIVDLAINNIFDEFYYDHGTFGFDRDFNQIIGIPESGRDIRLTLNWTI